MVLFRDISTHTHRHTGELDGYWNGAAARCSIGSCCMCSLIDFFNRPMCIYLRAGARGPRAGFLPYAMSTFGVRGQVFFWEGAVCMYVLLRFWYGWVDLRNERVVGPLYSFRSR